MSTEAHQILVGDLAVDVVRKDIKNLHLAVYPPDGRVRVAAPLRLNDEAIRLAVISRLAWIRRQREQFSAQPRQSAREYVSGESHYLAGERYRLHVVYRDGKSGVFPRNKTTLDLVVRPGSDVAQREHVMLRWYRSHLKAVLPDLVAQWEAALGLQVSEWRVKRMKTRWGTCNPRARRIWLNLELAKRPPRCLEYIVVHELIHLREPNHGAAFVAHMDSALPDWRIRRDELNLGPLAHEDWQY